MSTAKYLLRDGDTLYALQPAPVPALRDSACFETASGTALTGSLAAKAGDTLIAAVTTRSTTTYPSGWTVLRQSPVVDTGTYKQRMAVLVRTAEADGTVSCTVAQSSSARIYITLLAFTGVQQAVWHSEAEWAADRLATSITVQRPAGAVMMWCLSSTLWTTGAPYGDWRCNGSSEGMISLDQSRTQPRQACLVDTGPAGERVFSCPLYQSSGTYCICECIELVKAPDPEEPTPLPGAAPTAAVFEQYGSDAPPGGAALLALADPALLCWKPDDGAALPALTADADFVPAARELLAEADLNDASVFGIAALCCETAGHVTARYRGGGDWSAPLTPDGLAALDPAELWAAAGQDRRLTFGFTLQDADAVFTRLRLDLINEEQ